LTSDSEALPFFCKLLLRVQFRQGERKHLSRGDATENKSTWQENLSDWQPSAVKRQRMTISATK
jgi:hypothetical protein